MTTVDLIVFLLARRPVVWPPVCRLVITLAAVEEVSLVEFNLELPY